MNSDIYLVIALLLPLKYLKNYLLAVRVNRQYLWRLRFHRDFNRANRLNLSYQLLYKYYSQYSDKRSEVFNYSYRTGYRKSQCSTEDITLQQLKRELNTCQPMESKLIQTLYQKVGLARNPTVIFRLYHKAEDCSISLGREDSSLYLYRNSHWIKFSRELGSMRNNYAIPLEIGLISRHPLNYLAIFFNIYRAKIDLTLYREQIITNTIIVSNNRYSYHSTFEDWRGVKYIIRYNEIAEINNETIYTVDPPSSFTGDRVRHLWDAGIVNNDAIIQVEG